MQARTSAAVASAKNEFQDAQSAALAAAGKEAASRVRMILGKRVIATAPVGVRRVQMFHGTPHQSTPDPWFT